MAALQIQLVAIFLVTTILLWRLAVARHPNHPPGTKSPPGPKGKPVLGNLLDVPPVHFWFKFKEWADEYGPIFRLNIAGREHVILSTEDIANDLLRERGSLYSSREQLPMGAKLLSGDLRILFAPYNERWRRSRKFMHHLMMPKMADRYQSLQCSESKRLLYDLIREPSNYQLWFERYAGGIILRLAYGRYVRTGNEEAIRSTVQVVRNLERVISPGAYLVDTFPALSLLPEVLAPFKKEGRLLHEIELKLFRTLLEDVQYDIRRGVAPDESFARTYLENRETFGLTGDEAAYDLGSLFEAGVATTTGVMMSYLLAMTLHPEWQEKMWDELDRVVGEKMPGFEDIPQLPTVRAVIKEVLRWRPVTPGGVPHQLIKDDVYKGFHLKAGTIVHASQWAIHRDLNLYPNPEDFYPNRWLDPSFPTFKTPLTKYPSLQNFSAFGFGRRICAGQNIAERSLYILTARIAWASVISKKKDNSGQDVVVPSYDYTTGLTAQPNHFSFDLKPRTTSRRIAVEKAWEQARSRDPLVDTAEYVVGLGRPDAGSGLKP